VTSNHEGIGGWSAGMRVEVAKIKFDGLVATRDLLGYRSVMAKGSITLDIGEWTHKLQSSLKAKSCRAMTDTFPEHDKQQGTSA
jgi:hypothetical protein